MGKNWTHTPAPSIRGVQNSLEVTLKGLYSMYFKTVKMKRQVSD